jgi:hypothetical protein
LSKKIDKLKKAIKKQDTKRKKRCYLDSRSDRDLVFVSKDKPMLLPYSKRAGSTAVEYFEWDLPD